MSSDTNMVIKSLAGIVAGALIATGHLNAASSDSFTTDVTALGGTVMTVASLIYLLEHQFEKVRSDLYTTEDETTVPTPPTTVTPSESQTVAS